MWDIMEKQSPGLDRADHTSWRNMKTIGKYGLCSRGPCFAPALVRNRQHPLLLGCLAAILQLENHHQPHETNGSISSLQDVMVSHDRFTLYRPTVAEDPALQEEATTFTTGRSNIHLDLNPWWWAESSADVTTGVNSLTYSDPQDFMRENNLVVKSMGRHVQCALNFQANEEADGGTLVVPQFAAHLPQWLETHASLRKNMPWNELSPEVEQVLLDHAHRVTLREGSVLIWDQTTAHGSAPNASKNARFAQFLKAFSRQRTFGNEPEGQMRLLRRSTALRNQLSATNALEVVDELGTYCFGLDVL